MTVSANFHAVRDFHLAFGHPAPTRAVGQPADRAKKRANWLDEEAQELVEAPTLADQADAFLDGIYFNLGGLVELGANPGSLFDGQPVILGPIRSLSLGDALDRQRAMNFEAEGLRRADSFSEQQIAYSQGLRINLRGLSDMGIDYQPLFDIVHAANMAKLHVVDGKPTAVYHPDGKVKKPEGWVAPEPLLIAEIERQVAARG